MVAVVVALPADGSHSSGLTGPYRNTRPNR